MHIIYQHYLINKFYEHIFTRIFRFLGGASVLIILIKAFEYIDLQTYFNEIVSDIITYSIFLLASVFIFFHITKIIYSIYLLRKKPEMFEIRNSPLNLFASQIAKLLYCVDPAQAPPLGWEGRRLDVLLLVLQLLLLLSPCFFIP